MDNPNGNFVIFTFVAINTSASLQATVIDALYTKRLSGDIRGQMLAVKGVISNVGHFVFVLFALLSVEYYDSIHRSVVLCSIFDGSMFFAVMITIVFAGFDTDWHSGNLARKKGQEDDKKMKDDAKDFKEGKLKIKEEEDGQQSD